MTETGIAVVVAPSLINVATRLKTADGSRDWTGVTNKDGYVLFQGVPIPGGQGEPGIDYALILGGSVEAYQQPVTLTSVQVNATLRVGPSHANPQDISLPAAVPFA